MTGATSREDYRMRYKTRFESSSKTILALPSRGDFGGVRKDRLDAIEIKALSSEKTTGYTKPATYQCSGGRYPSIAFPSG